MDTFFLFEQLAHAVHHRNEKDQLIHSLPIELQTAFLSSDTHQLRKKMSSSTSDFPDSKTVV
jgi:hypothetical protein